MNKVFKSLLLIVICIFIYSYAYAAALGDWESFTNTDHIYAPVIHGDNIWLTSPGGLLNYSISNDTYTKYTADDGIDSNSIAKLKVEKDGSVCVLTTGSKLSRFDGSEWTLFSEEEGSINDVFYDMEFDANNILWVRAKDAIYRCDNGIWTTFNDANGLAENSVRELFFDPAGGVWCDYKNKVTYLSHFDGSSWTTYSPDNGLLDSRIGTMHFASNGTAYSTYSNIITIFDGTKFTSFDMDDILTPSINFNYLIKDSTITPDGSVFILYEDDFDRINTGILLYKSGTWESFTKEEIVNRDLLNVYSTPLKLSISTDGSVWVYYYIDTAWVLSQYKNGTWTPFEMEPSSFSSYLQLHMLGDGKILFYNFRGAILLFDEEKWTSYPEVIYDQLSDAKELNNGNIWIIDHYGNFTKWDGVSWERHSDVNGSNLVTSTILTDENDNIWAIAAESLEMINDQSNYIAAKYNLVKYDGSGWQEFERANNDPPGNYFYSVAVDPDRGLWCSTDMSICLYDGFTWAQFTREPEYEDDRITKEAYPMGNFQICSDGAVYLRTYSSSYRFNGTDFDILSEEEFGSILHIDEDGGIWGFSEDTEKLYVYKDEVFSYLPEVDFSRYMSLWVFDDDVWVTSKEGTNKGLYKLNGDSWDHYTVDDGLSGHTIYDMNIDFDGIVWALTVTGYGSGTPAISHFDGTWWDVMPRREQSNQLLSTLEFSPDGSAWLAQGNKFNTTGTGLFRYIDGSWNIYTTDDGLVNNRILSIEATDDGILWLGTTSGLSKFIPETMGKIADNTTFIADNTTLVSEFLIEGNYPNPFNPVTTISFLLPGQSYTQLYIYNIMGQKIRELVAENLIAGRYNYFWDGTDDIGRKVPSGTYIAVLKAGSNITTHRMLMIK